MRLVNRILVVCAGATLPAVVAVIGCAVDSDRFPGIGNDIPNARKGGGSTSPSSSSSSSSSGSAVPTICQCASTFFSPDGGDCAMCGSGAVGASGACFDKQMNCTNDTACSAALACLAACPDDVTR